MLWSCLLIYFHIRQLEIIINPNKPNCVRKFNHFSYTQLIQRETKILILTMRQYSLFSNRKIRLLMNSPFTFCFVAPTNYACRTPEDTFLNITIYIFRCFSHRIWEYIPKNNVLKSFRRFIGLICSWLTHLCIAFIRIISHFAL